MKVGIIGTRSFSSKRMLFRILDRFRKSNDVTLIVSGGARGADKLGKDYAELNEIPYQEFEAKWDDLTAQPCKIKTNRKGKQYNALAGFNRNTDIVNNSDIVFAFWDEFSPGTKDSIDKCKESNTRVAVVRYHEYDENDPIYESTNPVFNEIIEKWLDRYFDAEILFPTDLEDAVIGYNEHQHKLIISVAKAIEILASREDPEDVDEDDERSPEERALEYLEYNSICAYVGEYTPIWKRDDMPEEDQEDDYPFADGLIDKNGNLYSDHLKKELDDL